MIAWVYLDWPIEYFLAQHTCYRGLNKLKILKKKIGIKNT